MKINKQELCNFTMKETQMLIPMVMIKVAQTLYGESKMDYKCSIECMWNLTTRCQRKLSKTKQNDLVNLFKQYWNDSELDWETEIEIEYEEDDDNYVIISIDDITTIFINETRFDVIANDLSLVLATYSYVNGTNIYKAKEELILEVSRLHESQINMNDSKTWFYGMGFNTLFKGFRNKQGEFIPSVASQFVAYPSIETMLTKRCNIDTNEHEPLMSEVTFNKYMKRLEELGIICKVQTTYGLHGNNVVFCRVEHKEVCQALYDRYEVIKQIAKNRKTKVEQVEDEPTISDTVSEKQQDKQPRQDSEFGRRRRFR